MRARKSGTCVQGYRDVIREGKWLLDGFSYPLFSFLWKGKPPQASLEWSSRPSAGAFPLRQENNKRTGSPNPGFIFGNVGFNAAWHLWLRGCLLRPTRLRWEFGGRRKCVNSRHMHARVSLSRRADLLKCPRHAPSRQNIFLQTSIGPRFTLRCILQHTSQNRNRQVQDACSLRRVQEPTAPLSFCAARNT